MSDQKLYKGSLSTIILKLLSENDRMYGYEITQKTKEITQGKLAITEGALYPALHKLEADGLLEADMQKVDNRIRKYYKLTKKGAKETKQKISELEAFIETLQTIMSPKPSFG